MRWRGGRRSDNVEDRRGEGGGRGFPFPGRGSGGFRFPAGGRRLPVRGGGVSGLGLIILIILFFAFGGDLGGLLSQAPVSDAPRSDCGSRQVQVPGAPARPAGDDLASFISVVLADTEDTWHALFKGFGSTYEEPRLVLFSDAVRSTCGFAQVAMGPFYCPLDRKIYIDLSFYNDLKTRFRAPGDFAQAYVIAHEVGHHVQTLLGISQRVRAAQARGAKADANAIQVRMELQADCFAGLWAFHAERARNILEAGDIAEAVAVAGAIGDDRLQKQSQGYVVPDAFTHGASAQRVRWFKRGFAAGNMRDCDTFNADPL